LRHLRRDTVDCQQSTRLKQKYRLIVPYDSCHHRTTSFAVIGYAPAAHEKALFGKGGDHRSVIDIWHRIGEQAMNQGEHLALLTETIIYAKQKRKGCANQAKYQQCRPYSPAHMAKAEAG
jgi:hypothetical protein